MLYPGASIRLINTAYLSGLPMATYNRVNLHIAAGNGSLYNYFNQANRASSHFWVSRTGLVEQYVDTRLRAEADLQGNDATISIETEGSTAWSEAQKQGIIRLVRWICDAHSIPVRLAANSQPGVTSKGISWHRLGIDGNFPPLPSRQAGRIQRGGGMLYSTATGKTCPIDPNIDAIYDDILPGVLNVGPAPTPPPDPAPAPIVAVPEEVLEMTRFYRIENTNLAWEDFGDARRRITRAQYDYVNSERAKLNPPQPGVGILALPANDAFWRKQVSGDGYGEGYRKAGSPTVWISDTVVDEDGVRVHARRWVSGAVYSRQGAFTIVDLKADDPFFNLPTVGTLPEA